MLSGLSLEDGVAPSRQDGETAAPALRKSGLLGRSRGHATPRWEAVYPGPESLLGPGTALPLCGWGYGRLALPLRLVYTGVTGPAATAGRHNPKAAIPPTSGRLWAPRSSDPAVTLFFAIETAPNSSECACCRQRIPVNDFKREQNAADRPPTDFPLPPSLFFFLFSLVPRRSPIPCCLTCQWLPNDFPNPLVPYFFLQRIGRRTQPVSRRASRLPFRPSPGIGLLPSAAHV